MTASPLVSVTIIYLNAEDYLGEAIASVLAQAYTRWELWLVDDGSSDGSAEIARRHAAADPLRISCLEHPGHENRGMSASRNLGLSHARGEFVAFLDADDVWLPHKLAAHVAALQDHPEAAMVYGNTLYWHSWSGRQQDQARDSMPALFRRGGTSLAVGTSIPPPALAIAFLDGSAALPAVCGVVARRAAVAAVGGFEDAFRGLYEDQVFFFKVSLAFTIHVVEGHAELYRQHPASACAIALDSDSAALARLDFLAWLASYLRDQGIDDARVWTAWRRNEWGYRRLVTLGLPGRWLRLALCGRKWILRLERKLLPEVWHRRLWRRRTTP